MDCSNHRRGSSARRTVALLGALLMGTLLAGCKATEFAADWLKGDFTVVIAGVPEEATNLYFILGKNDELGAAKEAENGYRELVSNGGLAKQIESFEYTPQGDPLVWGEDEGYFLDPERPLTLRKTTKEGDLVLRVARHKFKADAENAIAVIVRYSNEAAWQGVTVKMNDFKNKEEAHVEISDTGLVLSLFDDYRKQY